jgi:23S rRNA (cytidine1920-2'-O)/16S rRNA (cytidine1409-2'-O)-methyltransferase
MVRRGLSASRSEATLAIRSGKVTVSGRPAAKAGMLVAPEEPIRMASPARRFVSRGGEKLEAALDRFDVETAGRRALDAGASTGGFTDSLLARGAAAVIAVDVGYGQLDWRLREDPRVVVLERTNVRDLQRESLPFEPDFVTADLSFISLRLVLPSLAGLAAERADLVVLVKPQFEAGRAQVGAGGVVTDPDVWGSVLRTVSEAATANGFVVRDMMASPLVGRAGNVEFLLHAARQGPEASKPVESMIADAVDEGLRVKERSGSHG